VSGANEQVGDSVWPLSDAQPRDAGNSSDHRGAAALGVRRATTYYDSRNDQEQTWRKTSEVVLVASAYAAGTWWYNASWMRPAAMADGEFRPMVDPASAVNFRMAWRIRSLSTITLRDLSDSA